MGDGQSSRELTRPTPTQVRRRIAEARAKGRPLTNHEIDFLVDALEAAEQERDAEHDRRVEVEDAYEDFIAERDAEVAALRDKPRLAAVIAEHFQPFDWELVSPRYAAEIAAQAVIDLGAVAEQETPPHRDPERHPPDWNDTGGWLGEQETR